MTVTTTETHLVGVKVTAETNWTADVGEGKTGGKLSVELRYDYTNTETNSTSTTKTVALTLSQVINAPPRTTYVATLIAEIGQVKSVSFETTAQRWYDQPVTGGVLQDDDKHKGLYKRTESVTGSVEGGLASKVEVSIDATPLP